MNFEIGGGDKLEQAITTTLEQRAFKINFHLQQGAVHFVEAGQELIDTKKEVEKKLGYGKWGDWLKTNCQLSQDTAENLIRIATRFGNSANSQLSETSRKLKFSQMVEMLKLPAGEEENFIAAKAAEGKPVETMSVKTLRAEVKDWKSEYEAEKARADKEKARAESLFADWEKAQKDMKELQRDNGRLQAKFDAADKLANQYHVERDNLQKQLKNQKPITVEPADYQQLQKNKVDLQNKITALQKQLDKKTIEVVKPADYDATKKELARLKAAQSEMIQRMEVYQNLGTVAALMDSIIKSPSLAGVQDFKREHPDDFGKMCAAMLDFTDSFYEE